MPVQAEVVLGVQTHAGLVGRAVDGLDLGVAVAVDQVEAEQLDGAGLLLLINWNFLAIFCFWRQTNLRTPC